MPLFRPTKTSTDPTDTTQATADQFATIPQNFGDGEFWKKYYDLALKDDDAITKRLLAELDVLLLFVSKSDDTI